MGAKQSQQLGKSATGSSEDGEGIMRISSSKVLNFHTEQDPISRYYKLGKTLGQPGGYGYAQLATHIATGEKRAVKVINKSAFRRSHSSKMEMFYREMAIMKEMKHPNVIKGYEMFEDQKAMYMVMEVCEGGELFDRIKEKMENSSVYTERSAAAILRQICQGIKYLHDNKIAHCDLKPDNFLFKDRTKNSLVKIIDFNLSKFTQPLKYLTKTCGTKYYIAPEVLQGHYTYHCDMWSFGVVMYLMLFGCPPFKGHSDESIRRKIQKGFDPCVKPGYGAWFPSDIPVSHKAKDLIAGLLDSNHATRLTAVEALEHPWLSGQAAETPMVKRVLQNLVQFSASAKLKNLLLGVMASNFSDPELKELKECFTAIDADKTGKISVEELNAALTSSGVAVPKDLQSILNNGDVDGDGRLSYHELVMASINKRLIAKEERLYELFCQLDYTKSGTLTPEEITSVLDPHCEYTPDQIQAMIAEVDTAKNGVVNYDEFLDMFLGTEHTKVKPDEKETSQQAQSDLKFEDVKKIIDTQDQTAAALIINRNNRLELTDAKNFCVKYRLELEQQQNLLRAKLAAVDEFSVTIDTTLQPKKTSSP